MDPPPEPPNRAPAAAGTLPAQTVEVEQTVRVDVAPAFTDADGDALTYTATSSNAEVASIAMSGSSAAITGVGPGTATLTVTARDPGRLTASQTVGVTVPQPNRPPVAGAGGPAPQTLEVDDTVSLDAAPLFSDPDGDPLTYAARSSDAGVATVEVAGSTVMVAAVGAGTATLTVTATDPEGLTASLSASVAIAEPNLAPMAVGTPPPQNRTVGDTLALDVAAFFDDPDGDTLTFTAATSNAGVFTASTDGSTVTMVAGGAGAATLTVTATDPEGLAASLDVKVMVTRPNRAPVAAQEIPPQTLAPGQVITIDANLLFSDPDGDLLTHSAETSDTLVLTASVTGGEMTLTPVAGGTAAATVTATDPEGLSASVTFSVTVTGTTLGQTVLRADFDSDDLSDWSLTAASAEVADGILQLTSTGKIEGQALHRLGSAITGWTLRSRLGRAGEDDVWVAVTVLTGHARYAAWSLHFGSGVPGPGGDTNYRLFVADLEAAAGPGWFPLARGWGNSNTIREEDGEFTDISFSLRDGVLRAVAGDTELFSVDVNESAPTQADGIALWTLPRTTEGRRTALFDWVELNGREEQSTYHVGEETLFESPGFRVAEDFLEVPAGRLLLPGSL